MIHLFVVRNDLKKRVLRLNTRSKWLYINIYRINATKWCWMKYSYYSCCCITQNLQDETFVQLVSILHCQQSEHKLGLWMSLSCKCNEWKEASGHKHEWSIQISVKLSRKVNAFMFLVTGPACRGVECWAPVNVYSVFLSLDSNVNFILLLSCRLCKCLGIQIYHWSLLTVHFVSDVGEVDG